MFFHCKSVFADAFRHQTVWRRGRIFVSICEWERESVCVWAFILIIDCGIPPPHWHLCTQAITAAESEWETGAKAAVEKWEDAFSVKKDATFTSLQRRRKGERRDATIKAIFIEGGGRGAAEEEEMVERRGSVGSGGRGEEDGAMVGGRMEKRKNRC